MTCTSMTCTFAHKIKSALSHFPHPPIDTSHVGAFSSFPHRIWLQKFHRPHPIWQRRCFDLLFLKRTTRYGLINFVFFKATHLPKFHCTTQSGLPCVGGKKSCPKILCDSISLSNLTLSPFLIAPELTSEHEGWGSLSLYKLTLPSEPAQFQAAIDVPFIVSRRILWAIFVPAALVPTIAHARWLTKNCHPSFTRHALLYPTYLTTTVSKKHIRGLLKLPVRTATWPR